MGGSDEVQGLGEFEMLVMLAVVRTGREGYSRTIRREIEEGTGRSVSRGALYVTLDRLTRKGLLDSWKGEPVGERGGKARRHYRVTEEGATAIRESRAMLRSMWAGIDEALGEV